MGGTVGSPRRWLVVAAPLAAASLVLLSCSSGGSDPTVASAPVSPSSTLTEMRPVPTVPPTTIEGGVAGSGVIDASPTIAPVPVDPNAPTTSVVAPTTDLVGDPQPNPDTTSPPPPPPPIVVGGPDVCEQLASFDIVGVIADTAAVTTVGELVDDEVCRYAAGSFVAEVHFVSVAEIRDDWFTREGIEPVGEVSSDAVGFGSFIPPGAPAASGYTIAVEGGGRGVIVAVTGTQNARRVAGQVAVFANQAASTPGR